MAAEAATRGRKDERRDEILAAALAVLAERGYRGTSMREIAARTHSSKETLYAWFGDKRGLFEQLIHRQAERVDDAVAPTLERDADEPAVVLRAFAAELIRLLLGERAVVVNRAAISEAPTDPTLARILIANGRDRIVPKLARYLEAQRARGRLDFEDAEAAVDALIGLAIGDHQVRRLLGVLPVPDPERIDARADRAAHGFLRLFAPSQARPVGLDEDGQAGGEGKPLESRPAGAVRASSRRRA